MKRTELIKIIREIINETSSDAAYSYDPKRDGKQKSKKQKKLKEKYNQKDYVSYVVVNNKIESG
jgi:hypothetical protein